MITRHDANRGGRAGCLASSLITQFLHADFVIGVVVPSGRVQARVTIENRAAAMGDGRAQSPARVRLLRETPAIADLRPSPMPTRSVSVVQIDAEFQLPSVLGIPPSNAAIVPACPGVRGLNGRSTKGTRGAPFPIYFWTITALRSIPSSPRGCGVEPSHCLRDRGRRKRRGHGTALP